MKYEKPIMEVTELEMADIVCLSNGGTGDHDGNSGNGGWTESN